MNIGNGLAAGDGTIMLLAAGERLCACRVNRVVAKVSLQDEALSCCAADEEADGRPRLLAGEFSWEGRLVVLLDASGLMFDQGQRLGAEVDGDGLQAEVNEQADKAAEAAAHEFPCVLFSCNNELFAFRFDDVSEVVESGMVTPLPGAPAEMAGVLLLRGFPLPVVSMKSLLFGGMEESAPYVLVVDVNGCPVGLQVEKVLGIHRFANGSLRSLLEEQSLLEGFLTTAENRLVGMIRFAALSEAPYFTSWKPFLIAADRGDQVSAAGSEQIERVLMFRHGREMMAVPLSAVERIEEFSEPTETPGAAQANISGVIQVQGNVTPVVRLDKLTGVAAGPATSYLIIREAEVRVAVPVEKVDKVINLRSQDIDPVRSSHQSLLSGVGKYQGTLVSLISVERLLQA